MNCRISIRPRPRFDSLERQQNSWVNPSTISSPRCPDPNRCRENWTMSNSAKSPTCAPSDDATRICTVRTASRRLAYRWHSAINRCYESTRSDSPAALGYGVAFRPVQCRAAMETTQTLSIQGSFWLPTRWHTLACQIQVNSVDQNQMKWEWNYKIINFSITHLAFKSTLPSTEHDVSWK